MDSSSNSPAQWKGPLRWTLVGVALSTGLGVLIGGGDTRWIPVLFTFAIFFSLPEIVRNPGRRRFFYIVTGLTCVFCVYQLGPQPLFAATIEVRLVNPINQPRISTGFWLMYQSQKGCTLSPLDALLFLRVTNLAKVAATITNYIVEVQNKGIWKSLKRVSLPAGYIVETQRSDAPGIPQVGRVIQFPSMNDSAYNLIVPLDTADYKHAAVMNMTSFDNQVAGGSIPARQSARGWAGFEFSDTSVEINDGDLRITITDDQGVSYPFIVLTTRGKRAEPDVTQHLMQISRIIDVSECVQQPAF